MKSKIIEEDIKEIIEEFNNPLKNIEGKTILITGANGLLASYIAETFAVFNNQISNPFKLILMNKNETKQGSRLFHLIENKNIEFMTQDIGKPFTIKDNVDIIFHAASRASVASVLENPLDTIDANINGLRTLLNYAKENKLEQFLFFSTADIYGNPLKEFIPTPETYPGNMDCLASKACYGESKRLGETMCMDFFRQYKTPVKLLRIFNTYGPGIRKDGKTIARLFTESVSNKEMQVFGTGNITRAFSYISDTIRGIFYVLFNGKEGEAYNIGVDSAYGIIDTAQAIKKVFNDEVAIKTDSGAKEENIYGINTRTPDISKLKSLGFTPKFSLEQGLKRTKEWYDEQRNDS